MKRNPISVMLAFAILCAVPAVTSAAEMPHVPGGFTIERIATVDGARELAITPGGTLFVGTSGDRVAAIADAEGRAGAPQTIANFSGGPAAGVAFGGGSLFVGTQFAVYRIAFTEGARTGGVPQKLASVRPSGQASDHVTTTVAYDGSVLFASVGSSCNGCKPELDATRATIQRIDLRTHAMTPEAVRIRNAIALAVNPATGVLWAGVAGIDDLPPGHPYEIFDAVTSHRAPVDYGWPSCYENRRVHPNWPGDCTRVAVPRVIFPAYETPIGAVFYPEHSRGRYTFPSRYHGGAFVTLHGSWHGPGEGLPGYLPPRVVFVPMRGDDPLRAIDWQDPAKQWEAFVSGYQTGGSAERIGRPTGIAIGPEGSLFLADDQTGAIYRIRPLE